LDAKQKWLPTIEADASYGKLTNIPIFVDGILNEAEYIPLEDHSVYDIGVHAYFNLYNGGKVKNTVEQAKAKEAIQTYMAQASKSDVHYRVSECYFDILRSKEFEKIIEHNIHRNNKRLEQIVKLYDNGVVLKSDLLRAQLQLSQQQITLNKVKNTEELSRQNLNMLLGLEDDYAINLTDSLPFDFNVLSNSYDDIVAISKEQSPFNKIADQETTLAILEHKDIKTEKLPRIGLFGEYTYSYPQVRLYPYANAPYLLGVWGIRLTYNISSLYTTKHKESASKLEIQKQILAQDNTEELLRSRIKAAYKKFYEDKENIEVGRINIDQAEENYRIVSQTYFNEMALLTDLLEADEQLLQAQFDLVNYYISARLHYYQLLKITGQL